MVGVAAKGGRARAFDRIGALATEARGPLARWSVAVAFLVLAVIARVLLDPELPPGFPFLTFFPAVVLTAFFAGTRQGVAVAGVCFVVAWYAFVPPTRSFELRGDTALALALFVFVTGTELLLVHLMRRALARLALAESVARNEARARALMFAELQHRVSNNLSVVAALLTLQRRDVADPSARRALDDAAQRIGVVSRLSRLLHDPSAQAVDFGSFLRAVLPDVVRAGGADDRVAIDVEADTVLVPADKAIPLGLIATELLANAIEHGFPGDRRGGIRVTLAASGADGMARLVIADDGVGLPEGFDLAASRSLGLGIAREFAQQLGGHLEVRAVGLGTQASFEIPIGATAG